MLEQWKAYKHQLLEWLINAVVINGLLPLNYSKFYFYSLFGLAMPSLFT